MHRQPLPPRRYPLVLISVRSRDSAVGIATCYRLEDPGIESPRGEIFRTSPDWLRGPPSLLYNGYRVFTGGKGGRGVILTTHPLLVPRLRESWAIPPLTPWVLLGLLWGSLLLISVRGWVDFHAGRIKSMKNVNAKYAPFAILAYLKNRKLKRTACQHQIEIMWEQVLNGAEVGWPLTKTPNTQNIHQHAKHMKMWTQ
jgi:hypothetical protein